MSDELLEARRRGFDAFLAELAPVLTHFATILELRNPEQIVDDPRQFLPAIDAWLSRQEIGAEDRGWLATRVGYFVGQLLIQRLGGHWHVNEQPSSRFYARYVVGMVDPIQFAVEFVSLPVGRSLTAMLADVEVELIPLR